MPWKPHEWDVAPDHRFDPYRERAGQLLDDEGTAGFVFVRLRPAAAHTGGSLWWRRWSAPFEQVEEYYLFTGGRFVDTATDADDLVDELRRWESGVLSLTGEAYRVEWLNDDESIRVRGEVFGLDAPGLGRRARSATRPKRHSC